MLITPWSEVPVVCRFGYPFLLWNISLCTYLTKSFKQNPCYLTDVELKRLHCRFGHPLAERLVRILKRLGYNINSKTLDHLTHYYHHY